MRLPTSALFLSALLFAGCGGESQAGEGSGGTTPKEGTGASGMMAASVYDVTCGCAVDSIGECGEYIIVEGKPIELTGHGLTGDMPFCKKENLKAKVAGKIEDGKFVATSFEYVQ